MMAWWPFNWRVSGKMVNRFRREVLSLQPQTRAQYLTTKRRLFTVQAYSRHIVPHPEDWPSTIRTTGFLFLEEQNHWEPPPDLIDFLDAGELPVCIGFGSMIGRNLEQVTRTPAEHDLLAVGNKREAEDNVDDMQPAVRLRIDAEYGCR
jgi:sterol 3beta-glucosyltransferase